MAVLLQAWRAFYSGPWPALFWAKSHKANKQCEEATCDRALQVVFIKRIAGP